MTHVTSEKNNIRTKLLSYADCIKLRTPNYCEENVWHILNYARDQGLDVGNLFALFITNGKRCVPFRHQKAQMDNERLFVYWDYHVIPLIRHQSIDVGSQMFVYDVDSNLPFPTTLLEYLDRSFGRTIQEGSVFNILVENDFGPQFRVVRYNDLQSSFSSDRRHMKVVDSVQGGEMFQSPPPKNSCIRATAHNLPHTLSAFLKVGDISTNDHLSSGLDEEFEAPGELLVNCEELVKSFDSVLKDRV